MRWTSRRGTGDRGFFFGPAKQASHLRGRCVGAPLEKLCGEHGTSLFRPDTGCSGCLPRKGAACQFVSARGPRRRFLLSTGVHNNQPTLQFGDGAFETDVTGLCLHLAGVAKLERRERTMLVESLPNDTGIVVYMSLGEEAGVVTREEGCLAHGEKVGQMSQRDERAAAAKILRVEDAAEARQIIFPVPHQSRILVPDHFFMRIASGDRVIKRRERNAVDGKKHAVADCVNVFHRVGRRQDATRPANLMVESDPGAHATRKKPTYRPTDPGVADFSVKS